MAEWKTSWQAAFDALVKQGAIFELLSLVSARWEFLGGLYEGTQKTDVEQAIAYVREFLIPVNPRYEFIHDMARPGSPDSDFFAMFRNKPLHGMTPAAVAMNGDQEVIAWLIGVEGISSEKHLRMDVEKRVNVNGAVMRDELLTSMDRFVAYLADNADVLNGRSPRDRWTRGWWARFTPRYLDANRWMSEGQIRGVPG